MSLELWSDPLSAVLVAVALSSPVEARRAAAAVVAARARLSAAASPAGEEARGASISPAETGPEAGSNTGCVSP